MMHWENEKTLDKASEILLNGGIIIYPTDTLYGFGCDAKNDEAIDKINHLKNRISPMSVIAPSKRVVKSWLNIKESQRREALSLLDEGKTIIVPVNENIVSKKFAVITIALVYESQIILSVIYYLIIFLIQ